MTRIEPATGGSSSAIADAGNQEKELVVTAPLDVESPPPEGGELLRKKQKKSSPPPIATEQPRAEAAGTSAEGLGSSMIPFDTTGAEQVDLKTLMELLFSFHVKGNGLLLQVSDRMKVLEHDLKKFAEECAEAKKMHIKVRTQLCTQHESFKLMKNDYEAMRTEEAVKQAETATKRAEDAEAKNKELEFLLQRQKEQIDQSGDMIQVQTDQMRNLKDNIQMIVEGWTSREADWLKGPIAPASPSVLESSLRQQVIDQYKTSDKFHEDVQDAVVNEFNDGFEYARELVREKGHDPDELGIVIPED